MANSAFEGLSEKEKALIETIASIVFLRDGPFLSEELQRTTLLFSSKDELLATLRARKDSVSEQSNVQSALSETAVASKLKGFVKKYATNDFDRALTKGLFKYVVEMFKKANLRTAMAGVFEKERRYKQLEATDLLTVAYTKKEIAEVKEDIEDLFIKEKNLVQENAPALKGPELSSALLDSTCKMLAEAVRKAQAKLHKCRIRSKNLAGDALLLALSVAYLGVLAPREKILVRRNTAEFLSKEGVECSEYWHSDSESAHFKLFKKILCEQGFDRLLHNLPHLYNENQFAEFLFCMMHAPSLPVVFDNVGFFQAFFESDSVRRVFASEYLCQGKLSHLLRTDCITFLHDFNDLSSPLYGKVQDHALLYGLLSQRANPKCSLALRGTEANGGFTVHRVNMFSP